jgi:hypothetical protein
LLPKLKNIPSLSICVHASGDAVTNLLVDVTPVFERTRQHWFGHTILEVTNDVRYQTITRSIDLG